jgi:Sulfotransferase domain
MRLASVIRNGFVRLILRCKYYPFSDDFQNGRRLFFVTGRSKSGNTWMAHLLNSHPALFCDLKENSAFHQDLEFYYLGSPLSMAHKVMQRYIGSRILNLFKNGLLTQLLHRCNKLSARRFGDKTPRQDIGRILEAFPKTQVIIMIRDFRDMCVSLAFHQARVTESWKGCFDSEEKKGLDNEFLRHHLGNYVVHQDLKKYIEFSTQMPDQVLMIRYEDLIADTLAVLQKVLSFLGVDNSPRLVKSCIELNTFQRLSGGRKSGEENADSFFRKGVAGDWRNYFSQENVETFKQIANKDLITAGYEKDENWTL